MFTGKGGVGGPLNLSGLRSGLQELSCPALGCQWNAVSPGMLTPAPQMGSPPEGSRIKSKEGVGKRFSSTDTGIKNKHLPKRFYQLAIEHKLLLTSCIATQGAVPALPCLSTHVHLSLPALGQGDLQ